ncbi:hypothetical protein PQU92_14420 [Asticcacaulis sp. BYS171W]|uniref:Uncharacterized protein n=1 Tax=Asticcacaulis aquaticus TaxID=2984212 RepID=A0ABT5HWM0_9CAUL|nr:hypothetical protein [Asticcacaulis aquaticus]MDC7684477.1 hypothetical protein [Asticcacaulis aquaticus]
MKISIDKALRTLRERGWPVATTAEGQWILERVVMTTEELLGVAALIIGDSGERNMTEKS